MITPVMITPVAKSSRREIDSERRRIEAGMAKAG